MTEPARATVGGGCFWCLDPLFRDLKGVTDVVVGYAGGHVPNPSYEQVCGKATGHAEVVQVTFDPAVVSYADLIRLFLTVHDPTTKDRQGNDRGTQYRSAIFPLTPAQRKAAELVTARVEKSGQWKRPLTTTIEAPARWVRAEEYHQDYLVKHPGGYDNHYLRDLRF